MKYLYIIILFFCCNCSKTSNNYKEIYGKSLNFDGIDDQISILNNPILKINEGTLEATIKIVDSNSLEWHPIITKQLAYQITLQGYQLAAFDWKKRKIYSCGPSLNDNKWHHVAFVFRDGVTNGSQFYLDGQAVGSPFTYNVFQQSGQLDIGGNNFWEQFFNGFIDEVRVWSKPLSLADIKQNATTEISKYSNGLLLYLKFNDGIASGDNSSNLKVHNETENKMEGYLYNFSLKGNGSNYSNESEIKPYNDNSLVSFFIDQRWFILSSLITLISVFIFYKFWISYLVIKNKKLEKIVSERTAQLGKMLGEKDVLIQEIHHRVKNNLQFIISLIDFELTKADMNNLAKNSLQNTSRRLLAMILVHQMLYRKDNFESISTKDYISELANELKIFANNDTNKIAFDIDIADFQITISQCTAIGIITSEMITNSIKYAFIGIEKPEIKISLKVNTILKNAEYTITDNGVGMKIHNDIIEEGIGKKLIDVFCRQLQGDYNFKNNGGVVFKLIFPLESNS